MKEIRYCASDFSATLSAAKALPAMVLALHITVFGESITSKCTNADDEFI